MSEAILPRFLIAAPGSSSGKTTVVCALLQALGSAGLQTAAFKSGPDYIDPMFHSRVCGAKSRNLDLYMLGEETVRYLLAENGRGADVAVLEGAMGYYDGIGQSSEASAYDLARCTKTPVILIVNGKGAALSLAALLQGFKNYKKDSFIAGAILNNVQPSVYAFYKEVLEKESGVKLLGYLPPLPEECRFGSRHLGLVTAEEIADLQAIARRLGEEAQRSIDLESLLAIAKGAEALSYEEPDLRPLGSCTVAVARDVAFSFYYQDALDLLTKLGAELAPFSPLGDRALPAGCSGLVLGGGYPELYAARLAANKTLLADIKAKIEGGLPTFAECGGFMYLQQGFYGDEGFFPWVGLLPGEVRLTDSLKRFGYVELEAQEGGLLCRAGDRIRGHEFHYSDSEATGSSFIARKAGGKRQWPCCYHTENLYAGYPHIHLWSNTVFAENFIAACLTYKGRR